MPNSQPFADDRDASFSTSSNLPMCTGAHGDVTSLTHAEVVRKRARNWYASLTQEQKDERNKKDRERRKRKKEKSQVLNKSATNSGVAPLGKLSNTSAADLMTCQLEVNDSSTLHKERSDASHLNITPRRLPFTIINNVAHYGPNEVPMSCVIQTTQNRDVKLRIATLIPEQKQAKVDRQRTRRQALTNEQRLEMNDRRRVARQTLPDVEIHDMNAHQRSRRQSVTPGERSAHLARHMDSFMDDDTDDEHYMFAGLGDDEDDEMVQSDDDDTQAPSSSIPDPFDFVYSNIPQSENVLKPETDYVLRNNPYSETFRSLGQANDLTNYRVTLNLDYRLDQRRYNVPVTTEVAAVWVEGNERRKFEPSVTIYGNDRTRKSIQPFYGCYDSLSYPLFFPRGESGWHQGLPKDKITMEDANARNGDDPDCNNRIRVSVRDYYCYKFQMRRGIFNPILHGGRLFQQFAVDMYIKVESSRLDYVRNNQKEIRADLYQGLMDSIQAGESRASARRYMDAMALVQKYGKPDVFLTMTSNPKWDEITRELEPGQTPQDRPDLVVRVFRAKLEDLKKQLFEKHILGKVIAHVYVVEFQKRGLPHAHFLLIMSGRYKLTSADQYDRIISAELPDKKNISRAIQYGRQAYDAWPLWSTQW
ncbi:hypothetical protein OsI_12651 [Oryza sativa Indica Group]|uniref:Helitron helicase-like domain-containing protein n=1 Tax=Oryza sativa subsp. indica TaxID=39946 RepID=B8AML2_ORYSI|nr:hypothetical protein OsI_12651 [Oryza sativa Indica Group]